MRLRPFLPTSSHRKLFPFLQIGPTLILSSLRQFECKGDCSHVASRPEILRYTKAVLWQRRGSLQMNLGFIESKTYDEISIGDTASTEHVLTHDDAMAFASISGFHAMLNSAELVERAG